jgi:hypothetical protein
MPNSHSAMFLHKQHVTSGKEIGTLLALSKVPYELAFFLFFTKHKLICIKQI